MASPSGEGRREWRKVIRQAYPTKVGMKIIIMTKGVKYQAKIIKVFFRLFVFVLIFTWIFTGWPPIHINKTFQFPPPIENAYALQEILRPNATGDDSAWTPNTTTDHGDTSDVNPSTYITETGDETRDIMNMTNPTFDSGSTINWVEMHMSCRSDGGGGPERMHGITRLSSVDRNDLNNQSIDTSTFKEYTGAQQTLDPSDGAWSYADLQALQIGGHIKSIGATEIIDCDEFWVVVDYTLPSALGVTAPASVTMGGYQLGGVGYDDYTFTAGELVGGAGGWSLTVSSTDMTGTKNTISNTNILLRTDGTLATEPTIITSGDSLTGVTETTSGNYSLDSTRTIVTASSGNGIGTYNVRPTIRVNIPDAGIYAETDTATLTFTVS